MKEIGEWLFNEHFEVVEYENWSVADSDDFPEDFGGGLEAVVCKHCSTSIVSDLMKHLKEEHPNKLQKKETK